MSLNITEYGLAFNLNANFDLRGATSLELSFMRPDGTTFTGVPTVPNAPIVSPDQGTFSAGNYARYIFRAGDLTIPGEYIVRLVYTDDTKRILSELTSFEVYP